MSLARVADGSHPWVGPDYNISKVKNGTHHFLGGEIQRRIAKKRVKAGVHNFQSMTREQRRDIQLRKMSDGTHPFLGENNPCYQQIANGTHNFLGNNHPMKKLAAEGNHPWTVSKTCPHCGKVGKGGVMNRYHFDSCKMRPSSDWGLIDRVQDDEIILCV